MKNLLLILILIAILDVIYSQAPQAFNYQAILRNSDGTVKVNETVTLQISIVDEIGTSVYLEGHNTTTNDFGLVNVVIGEGTTSDNLSTIDWSSGPYFVDITLNGVNLGSSPLLSVPYALYAASGNEGPQGPQGEIGPTGPQGEPGVTPWTQDSKGITYIDGNVGIGISATSNKLHVHQEASNSEIGLSNSHPSNEANNMISFFEGTTKQASIIARGSGITGGPPNALNIYTYLNQAPITLGTNTGEKIRIQDNGNVGIGTSEPDAKLHVGGDLHVSGNIITDGALRIEDLLKEIQMIRDMAGIGTVTDIDGNTYRTVKIGDQVWMAENLNVTRFNDGTDLYYATTTDRSLPLPSEYYCYYKWDPMSFSEEYGALYSMGVATRTELNICPEGWHIPNNEEWIVLENYLGGSAIAGGKMKETGILHWMEPNVGADNESGFTALPGGLLSGDSDAGGTNRVFLGIGQKGYWLVSQSFLNTRKMNYNQNSLNKINMNDSSDEFINNASIRCLKD